MTFKTYIYMSSFEIESLMVGHFCHGNHFWGECLAKNMIKKANFSKFFSDSSQIMLKLDRNIRWVAILWNLKKLMTSSLIRKYDVIIVILTLRQLRKGSLHGFFAFGWIKRKFGVRDNFGLLISNFNSKTHYQFGILRKCHFSKFRPWF